MSRENERNLRIIEESVFVLTLSDDVCPSEEEVPNLRVSSVILKNCISGPSLLYDGSIGASVGGQEHEHYHYG